MAPSTSTSLFFLAYLALYSYHPPTLPAYAASSEIAIARRSFKCEELYAQECAFAVMYDGRRCVLEKNVRANGASDYKCQTSDVVVAEEEEGRRRRRSWWWRWRSSGGVGWIESDPCVRMCGVPRLTVGFSTDALHEPAFTSRLCLSPCRRSCPNIKDLFTKLAQGEGMKLDEFCNSVKRSARRAAAVARKARLQDRCSSKMRQRQRRQQKVLAPPLLRLLRADAAPSPAPSAAIDTNYKKDQPSSLAPTATTPWPDSPPPAAPDNNDDVYYGNAGSPRPSSRGMRNPGAPTIIVAAAPEPSPPRLPPPLLPAPRPRVPFPFPHFGHFPPIFRGSRT